jgi:hypothetical protein
LRACSARIHIPAGPLDGDTSETGSGSHLAGRFETFVGSLDFFQSFVCAFAPQRRRLLSCMLPDSVRREALRR